MKILCPEHDGPIDIPSKKIADAFRSPLKSLVFTCPICQEEVLIKNIRLEQEVTLSNVSENGAGKNRKKQKVFDHGER